MTEMPSPPVDFSLRPNKAVERKLIFEALASLRPLIDWREYQYIGFGALWFRDFLLAHRLLHIVEMHSIEVKSDIAARARASRPLKCISVHRGLASSVLLRPQLRLREKRSIVWLDFYDTATASTLADLDTLCRDLPVGSVAIMTLNADPRKFGDRRTAAEARLRELFGDWVPAVPPAEYFSQAPGQFPKRLSELVWARALRTVSDAGRDLVALFNFAYKDGAPMITVGGIVASEQQKRSFQIHETRKHLGVLRTGRVDTSGGWPCLVEQYLVQLPVLTRLERLRLNRELPGNLSATTVEKLCGHPLSADEREAYSKFFGHYPTYAEIDL